MRNYIHSDMIPIFFLNAVENNFSFAFRLKVLIKLLYHIVSHLLEKADTHTKKKELNE